jgi:MSHA pilin protein MshA
MKSHQSRGFTLIELVVVITILGILAAFAIPKFIALDTQARVATINGLAGSVKSAAALARSLAMATGATTTVTMEGAAVALTNNYPDATAGGIPNAVNSSTTDFTYAPGAGAAAGVWSKVGAPTPATCSVSYTPAAVGFPPTVSVNPAGC